MGHYLRELFPGQADELDRKWERIFKVRKSIERLSLSQFIVSDLGTLYRVMGLDTRHDATNQDLEQLEERVRQIKSRKRGVVK